MDHHLSITQFLEAHAAGEAGAFDRLVDEVYNHLRLLAKRQMAKSPQQTLSTCGLVHEAYLKLARAKGAWQERGHFFAAASLAMRQILIDAARRRNRAIRGGDQVRVDLEIDGLAVKTRDEELLALDEALNHLEQRNGRLVRIVECRYFAGLSEPETAEALELSVRTVQRDWQAARAWLGRQLGANAGAGM